MSQLMKRPRIGDTVVTRFGDAAVVDVRDRGLVLHVETAVHGTEVIMRAQRGWWTVTPGHCEICPTTDVRRAKSGNRCVAHWDEGVDGPWKGATCE